MDSPGEILSLCRLCLVKDQVNIPIFDEQGDIRQIFLKISSCLPVTITRHDQLPKRICDACSNKLDLLYEFWNSSASAEKTLLSWLGQAGVKDAGEKISAVAQQIAKPAETLVKEESESLEDSHMINESQDSFEDQSLDEGTKDEAEAPPPKRARRTAAVKAQINITPESDEDEDDDFDAGEAMTKIEDESDESESELKDDPSYSEVPGTSADDQAGPSGVGKDGVEAPCEIIRLEIVDAASHEDSMVAENAKSNKKCKTYTYSCQFCELHMSTKTSLREHYKMEHAVIHRPFQCNECDQKFVRKFSMKVHMENCHNLKSDCSEGHGDIGVNRDRNGYIYKPTAETTYSCRFCNLVTTNAERLRKHTKSQHNVDEKPFKCHICGKRFTRQAILDIHIKKLHVKESAARQLCQVCGKYYYSKVTLAVHMKLHLNDKPFKCTTCGKAFVTNPILQRHLLGHTGNKPYRCDICEKSFFGRTKFELHKMTHTGGKAYKCDICRKVFVASKSLLQHKLTYHNKFSPN